jgi:hypothetical protein
MRDFFTAQPQALTESMEHRIHTRKWGAVCLLILGGLLLAGRVTLVPMPVSYLLLLLGHLGMLHQMYLKRDTPLMLVNFIWIFVDMLGMVRWWNV